MVMSDPILISDGEDEVTPSTSKMFRNSYIPTVLKVDTELTPPGSASSPFLVEETLLSDDNETPLLDDVTVVKCSSSSRARVSSHHEHCLSDKRVISLESDSEDCPRPETLKKYEPVLVDSWEQRCVLESGSSDADSDNSTKWMHGASFRYSLTSNAIEVDSDPEEVDISIEKMGRQKQTRGINTTLHSFDALHKKQLSKEKKIRATEEKKLGKEQEKLQKAALKAEKSELAKLEREKQKWENGKLALKSVIAEIDVKLVEGSLGGCLLSRFTEKGITYRVNSDPIIKRSIVWTMSIPQDIAQSLPLGPKIPYVLLVYEAEDFCNLVANERLLENISSVQEKYPFYTVCYLTNKLWSYVNKKEKEEYNNAGKSSGWRKPPIDEVLAKLTTHYMRVHSRHCVDDAEVAEHVIGLTSSLASCQFRKKLSWLSVNADGVLASKDAVDKGLIRKSPWLKALVAIPKVQPRYAVAVWKKYPSMNSLLKVYMDPHKTIHEKELVLKDLKVEVLTGGDLRLGEVCSKRIYRVLMSTSGTMKTDDAETGAAFFTLSP